MANKKINGREFQVGEVLATRAIKLQTKLLKLLGGGVDRLPTILGGYGPGASEEAREKGQAAAVGALADIFAKVDSDELSDLISELVSLSAVKRPSGAWEQCDLDGDFTADKKTIIPLTAFVIREVFGDFFDGLLDSGVQKSLVRTL